MTRLHPTPPTEPPHFSTPMGQGLGAGMTGGGPLAERIAKVIELIRPAVQADGGDIEFVGFTADHLVQIRMHGACVGCPSASVTLQTGIERNLKAHIPEVRGIQAVD